MASCLHFVLNFANFTVSLSDTPHIIISHTPSTSHFYLSKFAIFFILCSAVSLHASVKPSILHTPQFFLNFIQTTSNSPVFDGTSPFFSRESTFASYLAPSRPQSTLLHTLFATRAAHLENLFAAELLNISLAVSLLLLEITTSPGRVQKFPFMLKKPEFDPKLLANQAMSLLQ